MYLATRRTLIRSPLPHRRLLSSLRPEKPFLSSYNAKAVEEGWYDYWQKEGLFKPSSSSNGISDSSSSSSSDKKQFTMITPPPNVTGSLHIGHALTLSIEDALARYRRMAGYDVQWIPGTDHAGIGTQSVVEKMIMRERQLTRHDMGREAFVKEIWKWRNKYGDHILNQMKRMGASVDWDNVFFTMDSPRYEAVQNAFIQLYKDGLIYRDTRLVNWCCALETVISDIEIDYKEIERRTLVPLPGRPQGVEFGVLHQFTYPVSDPTPNGVQGLTVSTTRIETMLGDCAVAIHPDDPRYKELHGKYVIHPIHKKKIPIVCDEQLVDMEFGTGAVKITPAHDPNDYACARRHNLPIVSIFDKLGQLNEVGGVSEWTGTNRFDLRDKVVDKLKQLGCYDGKDENHPMRIALCSRSGDVIEPLLQPQWYVSCSELAGISKNQVENGLMKIHPSNHVQDWYRWLDNIQDWCISRQLWWGHEIPAYQVRLDSATKKELWVVAHDETSAHKEAGALIEKEGLPKDSKYELVKDEDVLDTWFSSGLLPLSALGWTGANSSVPARYPLQVMETGYDILFFWVARMAMLANHFAKQPPFENIFLHPMVRDAQGRKMSKSLGNVIDPLHVIEGVSLETMQENLKNSNLPPKEIEKSVKNLQDEYPSGIPACGTDSLRFALIAYTQQSRQINLDISNVIQTSHFCNKLWNLFKFGFGRFEKDGFSNHPRDNTVESLQDLAKNMNLSLVNRFILSRMADTVTKCVDGFENYRLNDSADAVRRFIVEDVCDVYVEFSKATLNKPDLKPSEKEATLDILHACMDASLRLAHPFMPFITEELWHHLKQKIPSPGDAKALMVESYPAIEQLAPLHNKQVETHFKVVLSIIHASRSLRQGHQISIGKELPFTIYCNDYELVEPLRLYMNEIKSFVKGSKLSIVEEEITGDWTVRAVHDNLKILVPTNHVVRAQLERGGDVVKNIEGKRGKLSKKLEKVKKDAEKLAARMNKDGYAESVPEQIKEKNRQRARGFELDIETLENDLRLLNNLYKEAIYSR
ncbi:tRNA synthetases class I-domain-containing protein [Zychaea mexicana]|uniref:tRNA synthetases class I-domain-containing protein n=1 Tax=Zychaea mexicana TaxID=64656 RepID=UPI0022FE6640|nr:tRNA synthetases class I-domain-containing protein [Zychaea mexicana]KAI9497019.1 tRNA synthetases class I-domain-containing protein [Zychaea mexicana]